MQVVTNCREKTEFMQIVHLQDAQASDTALPKVNTKAIEKRNVESAKDQQSLDEATKIRNKEAPAFINDETYACSQVQHASAVVGKRQYNDWSETGSSVRDRMSVIQTRIANTCAPDACQEGAAIFERHTSLESLLDDPCSENPTI